MSTSALMEILAKKKQQLASNKRQKTAKIPENRSQWRILPSWRNVHNRDKFTDDERQIFWHDYGQHFIKDEGGDLKAVYICVDKTFGKPCGICEAISKGMKASHDDAMTELLKEARAGQRVLVNALHIDGPNPTTPVILELPATVFEQIINVISEWDGAPLSLTGGRNIIVERAGTGLGTKYSVQVASKESTIAGSVEIMKKVADLDAYVAQENEESMNRALTSVASVSGLMLAAPAASKPTPASFGVEDLEATATPVAAPSRRAEPELDISDAELVELESMPAPAKAEAVPAAASSSDDELEKLLAGL